MKQITMHKSVWVPSEASFSFREQVDPHSGKKKFIMRGMMLPFDKISRNNVLYNKESIMEKYKELIGRPVMYNHKVDDTLLPVGHFINSTIKNDGWYYEADIDPQEHDMIRKLERGDLRHVSIQLIGGRVIERQNSDGNVYTEAYVSDIIEGSIVPAPGFLDTTAEFAEAFKNDVSTSTADGAIGGPKMSDEKRQKEDHLNRGEFPMDEFHKGLKIEMDEHGDLSPLDAARLVLDHLEEEEYYYSKTDSEAENMIEEIGEDEVKKMLDDEEN